MGKKRLTLHLAAFLAIALFAFLALGSASKGFVMDESLPPEESAKIWFWCFVPKNYNGIDLPEKTYVATIPAGEATFAGDIAWSSQGYNVTYTYNEKDVVFSYNFEGGKEYTAAVYQDQVEGMRDLVWGIGIFRELKTWIGDRPPKDRLIEFIPFARPGRERERIILE
jgi:hypothetical protein